MIQQFYDSPPVNSRKSIQQLFEYHTADKLQIKNLSPDFIAFSQERDKLGHLKTRQTHSNQQKITKSMSSRALADKQYIHKEESSHFTSDKTVERIFKIKEVGQNKASKYKFKLKLVNPSHWSGSDVPVLGNQKSAQLINKFKYKEIKPVQIVQEKQKLRIKANSLFNKPSMGIIVGRSSEEQNKKLPSKQLNKIEVDYDLPQLKTYNQMKKLKMRIYDNFEENHLKFKQLVRDSLVLAQKIKQGLEFD